MIVYAETKECGNSFIQSPRKPPQVPQKEEKRPHPCPLYSLTPAPSTASPPTPLRMERGVNRIVCKQRGHLFDAKEGSLQYEETPSSIGEGRFLVFVLDVPVSEVLPRYTETI